MPSRALARLLTGPAAFLLGGLLELGALAAAVIRRRIRARRRARPGAHC